MSPKRGAQPVVRTMLTLLLFIVFSHSLQAQYFGRNKVQWEKFDFRILHTDHFDIYYYSDDLAAIEDMGRMAERWYDRLSTAFNHSFDRKPIVLYANSPDFHQTTTTFGLLGEGTGGFTDAFLNRIVMPMTGDYAENDHVLGHEMVHVFQYDIASRMAERRRRFALEMLPLWLIEGMAEYFSKGRVDPLTSMWIRDAANNDRLPDFRRLNRDPRYFPYRYGQAIMAYIGGSWGDDAVVRFFLNAGNVGLEQAFPRTFGVSHTQFFVDWHASARQLYEPVLVRRAETLGEPLLGRQRTRADVNIAPSISPDGRWIAFLSTRELFSIDLFLADAATGRVVRRLVSADANPHFDALRFIDSAGSWSPDSRRLAFVVFERGDNRLAIVDVESGRIERIAIPGVEAFNNPAWSPDGRSIAFSGQTGASSDLFIFDLESRQTRRLMQDRYADLQPSWSPDGRTIVFATDRGPETDFELLHFGDLKLATINVATNAIRLLPLFPAGKHINPQFAPDGTSIYFIANPDGVSDVYRYDPATGDLARITHVPTGVAGITAISPALSVSSRSGTLAFSLFENDHYNVYSLPAATAGEPVSTAIASATPRAAILPPLQPAAPRALTAYLDEPTRGLPPSSIDFETSRYKPSLHLTYLGPPTVGVGADRYGFGVGGTISAYFSDVLGRHNVGLTIQGGGSSGSGLSTSIGGELIYLNMERRINWGGSATHIPYVTGSTIQFREVIVIDGQQVVADVIEQRRDILLFDELNAITRYPFGLTRRLEARGGYQRLSFRSELERLIAVGGRIIDQSTFDLSAPTSLDFFRGSLAWVGDSSRFGFISPVRGTRYRFEGEAVGGDLSFQTALADWRRYLFVRPVTFAFRGLHYGRYGSDAEDSRLRPLHVGQASLVRGYELGSFDLSECVPTDTPNACPVFDRLIGSRVAVASAEVRVPLFGTRDYGLINAPILPTEIVGFVDAGTAWTSAESPKLRFEENSVERIPVVSAGIGARILLSYIPIEIYFARPFQRPEKDWVFGFNITPGW
ncbi:MAG TPA: BamA/TamA family outer membrane protein [Thermoanaerobaculia bacterium]|nr:BamA/TamA family outer membrane protein [Thermoanaerobaculia bacterium]